MRCLDMRVPFHTAALRTPAYEKLHVHLSHNTDNAGTTTARNVLLTNIISSPSFDPKNDEDLHYLWDVWYSFQRDAATNKRFVNDVDLLLARQWSKHIHIRDEDLQILDSVWTYWKLTASNMKVSTFQSIKMQR